MSEEIKKTRVWKIWCEGIRRQAIAGIDTGPDGCVVVDIADFEKAIRALKLVRSRGYPTGSEWVEISVVVNQTLRELGEME